MTTKASDERTRAPTSRLPGFYKLPMGERVEALGRLVELSEQDRKVLAAQGALSHEIANRMIENAVATFELPMGIGLNFCIDGQDYLVPMAIEEPSVVAAVSNAAKIVREAGGFTTDSDPPLMIGQVQITQYGDPEKARQALLGAGEEILALANSFHADVVALGGGAREIDVRVLPAPEGPRGEPLLVLQLVADVRDAMGANIVNTMAEGVAPLVEQLTGGKVFLRILSNLCDRRLARATCRIPVQSMADSGLSGEQVCEGIVQASRFAEADPYRAATHNKGVMNGIDAVAIATGNDWRAIEAGVHAFACRSGRYSPLSVWRVEEEHLVGRIEVPLAVGIVGGPIRVHPTAKLALRLLGVRTGQELARVMAAVGLAQNMAAIRALGTVGIQRGHMALHARSVAVTAGARGTWVEKIA
ncbi:MAG: hydroxymethylglutaryl-CoA reductase, degradative, partial [Deltaproteobacteria bacterium]|nr:hydroxymethylglutaryl-CoA reductase, degradative [Deltaproteobacteria bacterium]